MTLDNRAPVHFMTFSITDEEGMSILGEDDLGLSDSCDIYKSIRSTENSRLNNQKQVLNFKKIIVLYDNHL